MIRTAHMSVTTAGLMVLTTGAFAHHASAPHFDSTRPIAIEGTVTRFEFVNPHSYLYVDVTDENGNVVNWNCEMNAAGPMARQGWTQNVFTPGMEVSIDGIAARRDPHGCSFQSATLNDGTVIARSGAITSADPARTMAETTSAEPAVTGDSESFAGTWMTAPRGRPPGGGSAPAGGGGPPGMERFADLLTEAGVAAAGRYDERFDDPALSCSPSSIIRGWSEPNGISEITIADGLMTIRHEFMDTTRVIDLTTREHPADIERSLTGHSIGWYEADTLIIETVGFAAGVLLPHPGIMHTEDMRIVERLSLADDGGTLIREYEVTDPAYMSSAYTGTNRWVRSNIAISSYDCTELSGINNIRPESD